MRKKIQQKLLKISENNVKDTAAKRVQAAKIYDLDIISKNIQTIKKNQTRFVIVSKNKINGGGCQIKLL